MSPSIKELVYEIRAAARQLDREKVEALCGRFIDAVERGPVEPKAAVGVLKILQRKRYFALLQSVGDALIRTKQANLEIRRRWLQSLIDLAPPDRPDHRDLLDRAIGEAKRLIEDAAKDDDERPEARGLLGRALKQRYVRSCGDRAPDGDALRRAIQTYADAYYGEEGRPFWHGINTVALLARAERDGVRLDGGVEQSFHEIAQDLLDHVEGLGASMNAWAMATGLEACVALGKEQEAVRWANGYAAHPGADAFELASTIRQLEEVWQLSASDGGLGAKVLPVLRSGLLRREDGSVMVTPEEVRNAPMLEKVLGRDSYVSLTWYREGLERARAVARITWPLGEPLGTGFLVRGRDLAAHLPDEWLLLTNHHVVNTDRADTKAVRPEKARVTFSALSAEDETQVYGLEQAPVWQSPELDAILLRLREVPRGVSGLRPFAITEEPPPAGEHTRVYIIGHPLGGVLSFSIHDNQLLDHREPLLHYRAPTNQGSSGSPIFNRDWDLIGLHHAGDHHVQRLRGTGTYAANEGIWIKSIRDAIDGASGDPLPAVATDPGVPRPASVSGPHHPPPGLAETVGTDAAIPPQGPAATITIPIHVTLTVGAPTPVPPAAE
jgi:S1-C subfamily serine protease